MKKPWLIRLNSKLSNEYCKTVIVEENHNIVIVEFPIATRRDELLPEPDVLRHLPQAGHAGPVSWTLKALNNPKHA